MPNTRFPILAGLVLALASQGPLLPPVGAPATPRGRDARRPATPHALARNTQAPQAQIFVGHFITLDSLVPLAEAVMVVEGRIVAVGSLGDVRGRAPRGTAEIRLPGVVLPGFIDAHAHVSLLGATLQSTDVRALSKAATLARVAAAARRAEPGEWITGGGWDQSYWSPSVFPTATELDAVSNGHPVLLDRIDGHAVWANSAAMRLARITVDTRDPDGGRIIRLASGAPSGIFVDDAVDLVQRAQPQPTARVRQARIEAALRQYARWGYTGVHDAGADRAVLQAYRALTHRGPLRVRVYAMASSDDSTLAEVLARGPERDAGEGTFTLRTVKVVDDGALGSRGARLSNPYADDPSQVGFALAAGGRLDSVIARASRRGFQVAVHAIGDASTHDVLDAFARAVPAMPTARFRLEHASLIRDEDVPRLSTLGVIASMQPVFVGEYSRFAEARVGAARLPWVYRTRDVMQAGAVIAAGTDFPASDTGDPIFTLDALVTRRGADGTPAGGWLPDQRIPVDAALRTMTQGAAFAAFQEREVGTIREGYRADFTVLSGDPNTARSSSLRSLRVLQTIVGGHTTFQR